MAASKISDEDFIRLWEAHHSVEKISKITGIAERTLRKKRRMVELRNNIECVTKSDADFIKIPENRMRIEVEMQNGMIIVGSDAHYQKGVASTAHRAFVLAIKELQPKMVIMNGDALDGPGIGRHGRIMWEPQPNVKTELEAIDDRLAEVEKVAGNAKLHWTWGNHDMRFNSRLSGYVAQFEGVKGFSLEDHFPRWRFSMSIMVNGHTMIKHRWHNGIHATYNNALKSGTSMVTGHLHALQIRPYTDYKGTRYAIDTGTLAAPDGSQFTYGEDSPANHRSGFTVLTFHNGRLLPPELVEVIDEDAGLVCFRGQVVQV